MRKRNNIFQPSNTADPNSESESDPEESAIQPSHPDESFSLSNSDASSLPDSQVDCTLFLKFLFSEIKQGKKWWVQILTLTIAAILTYAYNNVGNHSTNVQIAIMTVITLVGASPFCSSHLIPAAIGSFAGGHNMIGSTGLIENSNEIYASNFGWLIILCFVVGLVWCFVISNPKWKVLDGYAGRLGTTTFIGMNLVMLIIYGPMGIVDWDRYYYGLVQVIHIAEEDSTLPLAAAWEWTEEAELAIGYVLAVLWLGVIGGGTRIAHHRYLQQFERNNKSSSTKLPPAPLNNVLVPVLWTLLSILVVNATQYEHGAGLFNGFAVGAYVAMASLQKIPSVGRFAFVSLLAAGWGLALTPFFVGFAGKSGFTSMLGHVTHDFIVEVLSRLRVFRKQRQQEQERQQQVQQQLDLAQQQQPLSKQNTDNNDASQPITNNNEEEDDGNETEEEGESPHDHWPHIDQKPKKEKFITKYQRRQQQRLKHLQQQQQQQQSQSLMQDGEAPKLHHRAWVALPTDGNDGDGVWQHSLEINNAEKSQQEIV